MLFRSPGWRRQVLPQREPVEPAEMGPLESREAQGQEAEARVGLEVLGRQARRRREAALLVEPAAWQERSCFRIHS